MNTKRIFNFVSYPPQITFFCLLVLVAFISKPSSFASSWNEGLAGMLAVIPLAALELGSESLRPMRRSHSIIAYCIVVFSFGYYLVASQSTFTSLLTSLATSWGVSKLVAEYSWVAAVDYAFTSLFIILLCYLGSRPVTPWVYTSGMTSFLLVDTGLPYDSLGPLQFFVPPLLQSVSFLVNLTGAGQAVASGNIIHLSGSTSSLNLIVYWPSAGLHGMIIAVLAVAAVSAKVRSGWKRGAIYTILGLVGSIAVNTLRLATLAVYVLKVGVNPDSFEAFHSVVGELLFLPWIAGYVYFIVRRESRRGSAVPA